MWDAVPRQFDSDDPRAVLTFTENVECPSCGEIFEGLFQDRSRSLSVQDMVDAPEGDHQCPWCEFEFSSAMTGWMFYGEAG